VGLRYPPRTSEYIDVGSGRYVGHRTLAELQALGTATSPAVAVGSTAYVTDHGRVAEVLTADASSSTWGYKRTRSIYPVCASSSGSNALRFCSFGSATILTSLATPSLAGGIICVWPTVAKKAILFVTNDPGSVDIGTYKSENETALETITVVVPAATPVTFTFTELSTFAAGERLHIGIDPTNARTASEVTYIVVEIEETITL